MQRGDRAALPLMLNGHVFYAQSNRKVQHELCSNVVMVETVVRRISVSNECSRHLDIYLGVNDFGFVEKCRRFFIA